MFLTCLLLPIIGCTFGGHSGSSHYPRQLFSWRPEPSRKVAKTVREPYSWRLPSGINWQKKSTFPDGKPSGTIYWRWLPSGKIYPVVFSLTVKKTIPVSMKPSGMVQTSPVGCSTVRESSNFPCQFWTINEGPIFLSVTTVRETSF